MLVVISPEFVKDNVYFCVLSFSSILQFNLGFAQGLKLSSITFSPCSPKTILVYWGLAYHLHNSGLLHNAMDTSFLLSQLPSLREWIRNTGSSDTYLTRALRVTHCTDAGSKIHITIFINKWHPHQCTMYAAFYTSPISYFSIHLREQSISLLHTRIRKEAKMAYNAERNATALLKKKKRFPINYSQKL